MEEKKGDFGQFVAQSGTRLKLFFSALVVVLFALRLFLTFDLDLFTHDEGFHDDSLYVLRAFNLLDGHAFGPYDSRLFNKLPGISLFLYGVNKVGLPFLLSIHLLHLLAALYWILALKRLQVGKFCVFLSLGIFLFHPITLDLHWFRVYREALSSLLFSIFVASTLFILQAWKERRSVLFHFAVIAIAFSSLLLTREEDKLLWIYLFGFYWMLWRHSFSFSSKEKWKFLFLLMPIGLYLLSNAAIRKYVSHHYGLPILHELREGEFPKLVLAIRNIVSKKDNRYVWITQEALKEINAKIPTLSPVIHMIPPVGPQTDSCKRFRVCSEWTNGWMLFLLKDAFYFAGRTPDMTSAELTFKNERIRIEAACSSNELKCENKGRTLFGIPSIKWLRAFVEELITSIRLTLHSEVSLAQPNSNRAVKMREAYEKVTLQSKVSNFIQPFSESSFWSIIVSKLRTLIFGTFRLIDWFLILIFLMCSIFLSRHSKDTIFSGLSVLLLLFVVVRIVALAFISVSMGALDGRLYFSSTFLMTIFAPVIMLEFLKLKRRVS